MFIIFCKNRKNITINTYIHKCTIRASLKTRTYLRKKSWIFKTYYTLYIQCNFWYCLHLPVIIAYLKNVIDVDNAAPHEKRRGQRRDLGKAGWPHLRVPRGNGVVNLSADFSSKGFGFWSSVEQCKLNGEKYLLYIDSYIYQFLSAMKPSENFKYFVQVRTILEPFILRNTLKRAFY